MKELADIYLIKDIYDEAIKLYERLVPLKPAVETERLSSAYWDGINNCGVALAMQKRYDEAIKLFRQNKYVIGALSEANLAHYLGLFDVATSLYNELRTITDNKECYDEMIENSYAQNPLDFPTLPVILAQKEMIEKPLETARQKAEQEGNIAMYKGLLEEYRVIRKDTDDFSIIIVKRGIESMMNDRSESALPNFIRKYSDEEISIHKLIRIKDKILHFFCLIYHSFFK